MAIARDRVVLQSDVVLTTATTLQVITGLNWSAQIGRKYQFKFGIIVTGTATNGFGVGLSASPTTAATLFASMLVAADGQGTIDGGGASVYAATGAAAAAAGTTSVTLNLTGAAGSYATLEGIVVPAATQTVQLEMAPEGAVAMTIKAGSFLEWVTL